MIRRVRYSALREQMQFAARFSPESERYIAIPYPIHLLGIAYGIACYRSQTEKVGSAAMVRTCATYYAGRLK
jgi:hypothetical protein